MVRPLLLLWVGLFTAALPRTCGWMVRNSALPRRRTLQQRKATTTDADAASFLPASPTLPPTAPTPTLKKFFIETHGCTSNLADSDVVRAVLLTAGYENCDELEEADLILTNTCSIRENAEQKMFQRLKYFASLRKTSKKKGGGHNHPSYPLIGVLGCMAERLKTQLLDEFDVNFICGPDAYRTLPDLLVAASTDVKAANVQLSLEETYADIQPVRVVEGNVHAFVAISRGCNQHCAFCVVPYVRGVERSRPVASILAEVRALADQGVREVVLLGQTVNSYWDQTTPSSAAWRHRLADLRGGDQDYNVAPGFTQRSKAKRLSGSGRSSGSGSGSDAAREAGEEEEGDPEGGVRFAELLSMVAAVAPATMRVRFQAPHPKDFPDEVLRLIAATPNICNSLHMPAQHGSSTVLARMQRGYTREAYLALVQRARAIVSPGLADGIGLGLSSDFIAGFCGETDAEHAEHLSLLRDVGFDQAFTYAYSKREQTYAGLFYADDVPADVKARRLSELVDTFQGTAELRSTRGEVGRLHLVLVEGRGKRIALTRRHRQLQAQRLDAGEEEEVEDEDDGGEAAAGEGAKYLGDSSWTGRTDTNKRVVFPAATEAVTVPAPFPALRGLTRAEAARFAALTLPVGGDLRADADAVAALVGEVAAARSVEVPAAQYAEVGKGQYVVVKVVSGRGHTLRGVPVAVVDDLLVAAALDLPNLHRGR